MLSYILCSVLQCVARCCSVLQCVAVCCSVIQKRWTDPLHAVVHTFKDIFNFARFPLKVLWVLARCNAIQSAIHDRCSVSCCVAVCYSVLQCVAVCLAVLQCVAVYFTNTHGERGSKVHKSQITPFWEIYHTSTGDTVCRTVTLFLGGETQKKRTQEWKVGGKKKSIDKSASR